MMGVSTLFQFIFLSAEGGLSCDAPEQNTFVMLSRPELAGSTRHAYEAERIDATLALRISGVYAQSLSIGFLDGVDPPLSQADEAAGSILSLRRTQHLLLVLRSRPRSQWSSSWWSQWFVRA